MVGKAWGWFRNYLYDTGVLKTIRSSGFLISVGNLTWGGTGKTSLVQLLGQFFISESMRVGIVSRGYRRITRGPIVVNDGKSIRCSWQECGDEAYLLATELPNAVVIVAEDRAEALRAIEQFGANVVLLDDAFQHRRIQRDLDIVLLDASEDIAAQRVIPFGKLRESPNGIARASVLVLTHFKQANSRTLDWVEKNVRIPVLHADYVVERGRDKSRPYKAEELWSDESRPFEGRKIGAFCAIGAPHHFYELLRAEGAELVATKSFRDHHVFSRKEILDFLAHAAAQGAEFVVTTAKDAVRLGPDRIDPSIRVMRVKLQIAEESLFFGFVRGEFQKKQKNPQVS